MIFCRYDDCAAAVLDLLERWTETNKRRGCTDPWITSKSTWDIAVGLLNLYSPRRIRTRIRKLADMGFVEVRKTNTAPKNFEYLFKPDAVNAALKEAILGNE